MKLLIVIIAAAAAVLSVSCATLAGAEGQNNYEDPGKEPSPDYEMESLYMMTSPGGPLWVRFQNYPECTRFLDNTKGKRLALHTKRFEWFEAARKSETFGLSFMLEQDIRQLKFDIDRDLPFTCRGLLLGPPR